MSRELKIKNKIDQNEMYEYYSWLRFVVFDEDASILK
jgi:hypothetical protein